VLGVLGVLCVLCGVSWLSTRDLPSPILKQKKKTSYCYCYYRWEDTIKMDLQEAKWGT